MRNRHHKLRRRYGRASGDTQRYENRFDGAINRGLRAEIRRAVKGAVADGRSIGGAIRSLSRRVGLTASGLVKLEACASDYARVNGEG
jgi:hypothetical protein